MKNTCENSHLQEKNELEIDLFHKYIERIREFYIKHRYVFIPSTDMYKILKYLGAKDDDFALLAKTSDNLVKDPTLDFRESRNARFSIDFNLREIKRLKFQKFLLSSDEDFCRHDSGKLRSFRAIQDNVQMNTVFQALFLFHSLVVEGVRVEPRKNLKKSLKELVSTIFHLRTITNKSKIGEPALEGVHSDGVEHTMTTFLGSNNMSKDSAVSFIHDNLQKTGIRHSEVDPQFVLAQEQHLLYLDTLFIVDNERKHSLSPVYASDKNKIATRDMLIFFTRRQTTTNHATNPYDSLEEHEDMPLTLTLPDKGD